MALTLYECLSERDANALIVFRQAINDNDLRVGSTDGRLLALVRVGISPSWTNGLADAERSYFSSPDTLEVVLGAQLRSQHALVYETLGSRGMPIGLFISGLAITQWCYLGNAKGRSVLASNGLHWKYTYELDARLPYDLWIKVGGFPNWLVAIGKEAHLALTAAECMALVRKKWGHQGPEVVLSHYEEDSILAITKSDGACVVMYHKGEDDRVSRNREYHGDANAMVTFHTGYDEVVVEASQVICQDEALNIIEEFVTTGRPSERLV